MDESFRNANGVYMKLMNFRRFDPHFMSAGKKGLPRGAKEEEFVWNEFADDPERCAKVAVAIVAALSSTETLAPEDRDQSFQEAPEGRLLTRVHRVRERNQKLVEAKKQRSLKNGKGLICEGCGFDFEGTYGKRGAGFIECHHTKAVESLVEGDRTRIDDLALVCANCHRMIHRERPWLTMEQLANLVLEVRRSVRPRQLGPKFG